MEKGKPLPAPLDMMDRVQGTSVVYMFHVVVVFRRWFKKVHIKCSENVKIAQYSTTQFGDN